jgi:hypothetical protein
MLTATHQQSSSTSRKSSTLNNILSAGAENKISPNEPHQTTHPPDSLTLPSFSEIISPTSSAAQKPNLPAPPMVEMSYPQAQFVCLPPQQPQLMPSYNMVPYPQPPPMYPMPRFHPAAYQYYVRQQAAPSINEGNPLNFLATMASVDQSASRHPTIYPKHDQSFQFHQQKIPNAPISEQPVEYPCTHVGCRKVFPSRSRLHRHEIVHLGEKNFKCIHPGCEKRFSRKDNMLQHYRNHGVSLARETSKKGKRGKADEN